MTIPDPVTGIIVSSATKAAGGFADFVTSKLFGKSMAISQANAEVEADKIKTKWEMEKPFWQQAEQAKIVREYTNLGSVLEKSARLVTAEVSNIKDDNDVFWGLLEHSKTISNEEVQDLISKIIAGEYNNPDTYSMSTLQTLKSLGKKDIELLERFGTVMVNKTQIPASLFTGNENVKDITEELEIDFGKLQILQSLGLILPNQMIRRIPNPEKKKMRVSYFDKDIIFEPENIEEEAKDIRLPDFYDLSNSGIEIMKHLNSKYNENFLAWLIQNYKINNYKKVSQS